MQFGVLLRNWGEFADADLLLEFGVETERAGWDGVFLADHLHYGDSMRLLDPWITLSGLARQTQSIKLGSWITPVPRRLPWQLARNLATLDQLSDGRVILGAGLGAPPEDYTDYGIEYDTTRLAKRFDESLDIIDELWSEGPFSYEGGGVRDHGRRPPSRTRPNPADPHRHGGPMAVEEPDTPRGSVGRNHAGRPGVPKTAINR